MVRGTVPWGVRIAWATDFQWCLCGFARMGLVCGIGYGCDTVVVLSGVGYRRRCSVVRWRLGMRAGRGLLREEA